MLNNPKITLRLEELRGPALKRAQVSHERVVTEAARLAFLDPRRLFDAAGTLKPIHELNDETAAAVASLEVVTVGNAEMGLGQITKVKLWDKNRAIDTLAKLLGYFDRDNQQKASVNIIHDLRVTKATD